MHIPPACFQRRPNLLANHRSGQSHPEMERHPPPDAEQSWTSCSFNGKPWSYIWEIVISNDKLMITTDTIIVSDNGGFTCGRNDTTLARKWIKIGGSMAPNISLPWFNLLCLRALCFFFASINRGFWIASSTKGCSEDTVRTLPSSFNAEVNFEAVAKCHRAFFST